MKDIIIKRISSIFEYWIAIVFISFILLIILSYSKIAKYIILFAVFFLIIISYLFYQLSNYYIIKLIKNIRLDHYTIWQIVMALAIQLLIHQKVIWEKQKLE